MANLLVIYVENNYPPRLALANQLFSFARSGGHRVAYLNLYARGLPRWAARAKWDAVIFDNLLLCRRRPPADLARFASKIEAIRSIDAVKVALPQDEYVYTDVLAGFIRDFGVSHVFSVSPETEWPKIYGERPPGVKLHRVLTGYLDDGLLANVDRLAARERERPIDVGYRAWLPEPASGRHGLLKKTIADVFSAEGKKRGLRVDISLRGEDALYGDDWLRFFLRCRYTIGVEGGSSLLDRDGSAWEKSVVYQREHPGAGFDEIERACFPGRDGSLALFALSPRHLEACATRTCQILVEGAYDGVLAAGSHYIELKRDMSNAGEICERLADEKHRLEVVERARRDVVDSRRFAYQAFVERVVGESLAGRTLAKPLAGATLARARLADWLSWRWVQLLAPIRPFVRALRGKSRGY